MNNKKILFIVSEDWYFYSHRLDLAIEGIARGYNVSLLTNFNNHKDLIKENNIETIELGNFREKLSLQNELKNIYKLYKTIQFIKPDIIHAVSIKISIYTSIVRFFTKTNHLVCAISGLGYIYTSKKKSSKIFRIILDLLIRFFLKNKKTQIIVQNPDDLKKLVELNIDKINITLIKGVGVNTEEYKPNNNFNKVPRIILASRLLWSKGILTFYECAKQLKEEGIIANFILAGKPDEKNPDSIPLEILNSYNNNNIIKWIGHIENMSEELANSDIMLFPTLYGEGVPKILLEAASVSLPIVTYDVPGCREIVENNFNGFLVDRGNKKELVKKIKSLIIDINLRIKMGSNGRKKVIENFSSTLMNNRTISVWDKSRP